MRTQGTYYIRGTEGRKDGRTEGRNAENYVPPLFFEKAGDNKKLDPKRALFYYLKKTDNLRAQNQLKLFVSIVKPHQTVSTQTISKWIVNTIRMAYDRDIKTTGHSTRAIGPSWALFKGASMHSILDAADWSKETTFTRFYLRDVDVSVLK